MSIDLSIIIPCHNLESYITKLLDSLNMQQIGHSVQLIFILDNCNDKTYEVIRDYKFNVPYADIIHIHTVRNSAGGARNLGLDIASGKYIWFIDGDDWLIHNQAIEIVIQSLEKNNGRWLRFGYEYSDNFEYEKHLENHSDCNTVWQHCFRRDLIGDTRFLDIQPHEDFFFLKDISDKVNDNYEGCFYNDAKLYYYNYGREGSNMRQFLTAGKVD